MSSRLDRKASDSNKGPLDYLTIDGKEVAASVGELQTSIEELRTQLQELANKCLGLSRVAGLLLAIRRAMELLPHIYDAFYWNGICLAPEFYDPVPSPKALHGKWKQLPSNLKALAEAFLQLHVRINEFKALADEDLPLKNILEVLEQNLRYRASCAREYEARSNTRVIRYYVHQYISDLITDFKDLAIQVKGFAGDGITAIRYEQERSSRNFQVVLTVSTFFSSVTGSALQMAVGTDPGSRPGVLRLTLVLWFTSMVFSIGAAMNSLLAIGWRGTSLGKRGDQLPRWAKKWTEELQLVFLGASIATFSVGLVTYTFSSSEQVCHLSSEGRGSSKVDVTAQSSYTPPITLGFSSIVLIGGTSVLIWMILDTRNLAEKDLTVVSTPHAHPRIRLRETFNAVRRMAAAANAFASVRGLSSPGQQSELIPSLNLKRYGTINDVAYSNDGRWLAITCASDRTVIYDSRWNTNDFHRDIRHKDAIGPGRLFWSPSGACLIVKFDFRLEVWNLDAMLLGFVEREYLLQDVQWCNDETFLMAGNGSVLRLVMASEQPYTFRNAQIRSIGFEETTGYLIAITEVARSREGIEPKRCRLEKRIIVYDMKRRLSVCEIPSLDNIQSVHPLRNIPEILIVCQEHDDLSFQLCTLNVDSFDGRSNSVTIKRQIISPHSGVEKRIGPTRFGGNFDQFILCSLSSGAIGVWDSLRCNMFYGNFAPEILQDKRLSAFSWKTTKDGSQCLAAVVKSSEILHIWRGKRVIWGLTDSSVDLMGAYDDITYGSPYFPQPFRTIDSPEELQEAYHLIATQSLYVPQDGLVDMNSGSSLHNAYQDILENSLYVPSPPPDIFYPAQTLENAYKIIATESPYVSPLDIQQTSPDVAEQLADSIEASDFTVDETQTVFDAYSQIYDHSLYFGQATFQESSQQAGTAGELLAAFDDILDSSLYSSPPRVSLDSEPFSSDTSPNLSPHDSPREQSHDVSVFNE
ncbi:hypothetical protein NP233_g9797 [Leucocoprinus birnbaumii]|uniref:Uncharacterized protein n=1 Tax=Leucocoprinus birnbaumii TaxID=56174 RepID=A0AAD5VM39_9AGAR|nr:hypothetical protein NP233_g9797 [Leucocoprinus birnbaumii]